MSKRGPPGEEGGRARWSNFPNEVVDGAGDLLPVLAERQLETIGAVGSYLSVSAISGYTWFGRA